MATRKGRGDDYHVTKTLGEKWKLKQEGSERASGAFDTQAEAAARGRELAEKAKVDLVIHGVDGKIRSKDSYGNESKKKDTEH